MAKTLKKFKELLIGLLKEGKSANELALALALGCILGVFPIFGVTTVMSIVLGKLLKLNIPAIIMANYAVFPFQIFLIYALIKTGEVLFSIDTKLDYVFFKEIMEKDLATIFNTLSTSLLAAVFSWLLFSAALFFPLYYIFLVVVRKIKLSNLF